MKATIDKAGRLVIPKVLRDRLGLTPGLVEVEAQGAGIRVVPVAEDTLDEESGLMIIPSSGVSIDDQVVRALRDVDQR